MKVILSAVLTLALLAGLAPTRTPASAQGYEKAYAKKKQPKKHHRQRARGSAQQDVRGSGYYEVWSDKLPFGSQVWWDAMARENRDGPHR